MKEHFNEISVFFPAYNEQENIVSTVLKADKVIRTLAKKYEILVIDDGSTDKTAEVVKGLQRKNKNIKLIQHKKNKGYGAALATGLYHCKYDWITYTDADGQHDFSEISKFIEAQKKENSDIVISHYAERKVALYRKIYSYLWQSLIKFIFDVKAKDIGCAFKLIRKKVITEIPKLEAARGNFLCTEFLVKAQNKGFKITEIPITHHERTIGQSTAVNLSAIIHSLKDVAILKNRMRQHDKSETEE